MNKRRRLDEGADSYNWQEVHFLGGQSDSPYGSSGAGYAGAPQGVQETAGQAGLNENSEASSSWPHTADAYVPHGALSMPYPDVTSYQQPYFSQQTDPSTYNSPWPPADTQAYGTPGTYPMLSQSTTMPFFPVTQTADQGFDAATAFQGFPELDAAPPQYDYVHNVPQERSHEQPKNVSAFYFEDASMHLKIQSLPILENLASQLIEKISKASFAQIQDLMRGSDAEDSQAYVALKSLFDQTRRVYSRDTPFIDAIAIQMFQPNQQEIVRKANIATFISSILGANDVSFFHLNEFFMETFVPLGHRLLKWQGAVFLDLKTQTYISALLNSDSSPEAMLDELFPGDMDAQILTRHPDAPSLSPSEQDFIDRSRQRKSYLLDEKSSEDALRELPQRYKWSDFIREFASSISKNIDGIMNVPARTQPGFGGNAADRRAANAHQAVQDSVISQQQSLISKEFRQQAQAIAQQHAMLGVSSTANAGGSGQLRREDSDTRRSTAPTSTVRQPWTKPEEDALLAGLDRVNGPHWSQILALYGRGGSVSEVLKDRNQVQLKDKARNLKLWYLKMGKEVPMSLRGVTGELRKRGGARARAALGLDDDEQAGSGADKDKDAGAESGENIDPSLGEQHGGTGSGKSSAKKKGGKKSGS